MCAPATAIRARVSFCAAPPRRAPLSRPRLVLRVARRRNACSFARMRRVLALAPCSVVRRRVPLGVAAPWEPTHHSSSRQPQIHP